MSQTPNLALPYLYASQAQKHVIHNEALRLLDAIVQLTAGSRSLSQPPAEPQEGDRYIVGAPATGAWSGQDGQLAAWQDGAWMFFNAKSGWRVWVQDEALLLIRDGNGWIGATPSALQNLMRLGVGTEADGANPFAAKLNSALWTALTAGEGGSGNLYCTLNKETASGDLGLAWQTGYVTKALLGLFGSDRFRLAVSAEGSSFVDSLVVDNANGIVDQPRLPRFKAYTDYDNYVGIGEWTKIGINNADYNGQNAFDAGANFFVAPANGTYVFGATLVYKINADDSARMGGRLVQNGSDEIRGSRAEVSGSHLSEVTALLLQTLVELNAGDTVELQGHFREADGYFAADHTSFWGLKTG